MATRQRAPVRVITATNAFGRGHEKATLTDLGCPDCRGVLTVVEDPDAGHMTFRCRVGHAFSAESLLPIKEDQLEGALWTVVELYEEIALLHGAMGERAAAMHRTDVASAYARRVARALRYAKKMRVMIAEDSPAFTKKRARRR
jgi:two-component system chemotaxis response regulator CheB